MLILIRQPVAVMAVFTMLTGGLLAGEMLACAQIREMLANRQSISVRDRELTSADKRTQCGKRSTNSKRMPPFAGAMPFRLVKIAENGLSRLLSATRPGISNTGSTKSIPGDCSPLQHSVGFCGVFPARPRRNALAGHILPPHNLPIFFYGSGARHG